jgi:hemerythrin superfamily protein
MSSVPSGGSGEQLDGIQLLLAQHQQVRHLFGQISEANRDGRKEPFEALVRLLAVHETAEEEVVHPMVRAKVENGDQLADARLEEEAQAKRMLSDLEKLGSDAEEFIPQLEKLEAAVNTHAAHEEQDVFPKLAKALDGGERELLATLLRTAEATAPTHPHPHGPESAIGNLVVGPFVAIADRVRDALRGVASKR